MRLGVDPKHADQMVRGTVVLPHGLGKTKKVLVIATGEKVREAEAAGADIVGGEDMVEKIQKENWTDYDAVIATPDMMKSVGRLGKVLGPRGLMPNPEDRHRDLRRGCCGEGNQGRQGGVPHRQDRAGARAGGQDFVPAGEAGGERCHGHHQRDQGKADGGQGQVHQGLLSQLDHGTGCRRSTPRPWKLLPGLQAPNGEEINAHVLAPASAAEKEFEDGCHKSKEDRAG